MSKLENSFPDNLRSLQHCPVCQNQYTKEQSRVLEEKESASLLHLFCGSCRHAVVALMVSTPFGASSVGMLTDLDFADAKRLLARGPVSEEELLNFHQFLKTNQFNFKY